MQQVLAAGRGAQRGLQTRRGKTAPREKMLSTKVRKKKGSRGEKKEISIFDLARESDIFFTQKKDVRER